MYTASILVHSWLRWAVLLSGLFVIARALSGWSSGRPWTRADRQSGLAFVISLDLQFLLGLALYLGISPLLQTVSALGMATVMKTRALRFFAVEHFAVMLLAWVLAHVIWVVVKRTPEGP